ncbi:hypothetical protein QQS21_000600 [Conoideocrella luteorostrata]|uniref:Thioester reductase (TE) domain-containing protein n=1 Tax=Conoideocrella luteorostrata TaxID=1105319 RepID=A0AAJ0D0Z4_9HYPO|nr:hypothetical protein QQS21_000600 [Conoideocrella luteorostrata]
MSKQLIAIIEQDGNVKDFSTTVKTELSTRVSNAMVPTRWIDVAALFPETKSLPLNPSGKLDRRLLLTSVQKLTESRANEIFSTLDSEYATNFSVSDRIFESEQPAFDLAKKVHAIMKSPSEAKHNTDKGPSFDNICLVSAGLDSLNMMSLMFFISQKFSVNLALPTLLQRDMTLRKLAKLISRDEISTHKSIDTEQKSSVVPSIDIAAEIERHDALLRSWQPIKRRKTVLLTGANGYIGTEILRQLLEHPQIRRVIALVRGETPFAAKTRTIAAANRARWWTDLHEDNLEVWQGDLSQDKLGLSAVHWDQLQDGNVDFIVHNGAAVHWTKDFKSLEAANIDSTVDLLSVAMRQPHIRMTYITGGRGSASPEETDDDIARELSSPDAVGYCQTKFVAEALVKRAARRCGDRFSIISPGLVAGTPEKGVANSDDYLWRLAASCIRIGAYNANQVNCWLQVSDVASLASIIVGATLEPKTENETASIVTEATDGMTWGQFWDILKRLGYKLESLPSSHWLPAIRNDIEQQQEEHPLWPLAHMLETHLMEEDPVDIQRQQAVVPLKLKVAIKRSAEFLAAVQFLPSLNNENDEYSEDTGGAFSRSGK